jgi:hypothetical protein
MKNASPVPALSHERLHERCVVPALERGRMIRPLCHEHHTEMSLNQVLLKTEDEATQTYDYLCPVPRCLVRYSTLDGYFIATQNGTRIYTDTMPRVRCEQDGMPMYLAEVLPERRSFRLWKCPQCNMCHASGDLSVAH